MNNFSLTRQDTLVMKGIAICAMLCHHLYTCPEYIGDGIVPYTGVQAWLGGLGKVCVALFLFCSGYGLSANYKPISIKEDVKYVAKRLVKFYINYWVIFLIFVPIGVFLFHHPLSDAYGENVNIYKRLLYDFIGIQGYRSYNITWWFNELIIVLYILFPILYKLVRLNPWITVVLSLLVVYVSDIIQVPYDDVDIFMWQWPFILGIAWKLCEENFQKVSVWLLEHKMIFAIWSLMILAIVLSVRIFLIIPYWCNIIVDGFVSCGVALCIVSVIRYLRSMSAVSAFLGKHSMNIYLTHTFINGYWRPEWLHTGEWMRGGGNFIVLMTICLLISITIEFLKEKIQLYELMNIIINKYEYTIY